LTQIARLGSIIPYLLLEIGNTTRSPIFEFRQRLVITPSAMISIPATAREGTASGYEGVVNFDDTKVKLFAFGDNGPRPRTCLTEQESAHRQVPLGTGLVLV
jgi:hypothetical protein